METTTTRYAWFSAVVISCAIASAGCFTGSADDEASQEDEQDLATVALGVDTNGSTIDIGYAKENGRAFVGRYVSFDGAHPALSAAEVTRFRNAQMPIIAIWETGKKRAVETSSVKKQHQAGIVDGQLANAALETAGVPGKAVYFTVDFDLTPEYWTSKVKDTDTGKEIERSQLVIAYFKGVNDVIGAHRTGAYGTYATIKGLFDEKVIAYGWQQTFGGRGAHTDSRAQLRQTDIYPDQTGWGVSGAGALDLDRAVHANFGQF